MIKKIICLCTIAALSLSAFSFAQENILTTDKKNQIEAIGNRIVAYTQDKNISIESVIFIIQNYKETKDLAERNIIILAYLESYLTNTGKTDLIPWSIEEMRQKSFVGKDLALEEVLANNETYTRYRISYKSNGLTISGIMNIPHGAGPYPLFILNHGYIDPTVYTVGRGLKREQDYLARNGYAVLHTDYRNHGLSDGSPDLDANYYFRSYFYGTDSINAINAVINWGDNRIDTNNVAMMGHSMGGGVTLHSLLAQPELIDAAIMYAPVHARERENFERWRREDLSQSELNTLAGKIGDINLDSSFAPYSPNTYLGDISIPLQYYHGTNDKDVPYNRSVETVKKLQESNVAVELITYDGEQHEFGPRWNDFMQGVVEFLDKELQ